MSLKYFVLKILNLECCFEPPLNYSDSGNTKGRALIYDSGVLLLTLSGAVFVQPSPAATEWMGITLIVVS